MPQRSKSNPFGTFYQVPVVHFVETPDIAPEQIPQILREINERQFAVVIQVLAEAKYKAEAMLRDDSVMNSHGRMAFFLGWGAYADYVISSLETLRTQPARERAEMEAGPE
jgi:hypothetical protein